MVRLRHACCIENREAQTKGKCSMKNPTLFFGGVLLVIIGIALGIFFLIPGINHIITDSQAHSKHAIACFALAILGLLVALVNRPTKAA
jgi:uncharacterized membrane protein HdeD (DUF308 family)